MDSFLGSVARAYVERGVDLSEYCFLFPNRRSGTFFLRQLSRHLGDRTIISPEVLPMGDFMSRVAQVDVAPRVTQLMELYLSYRTLRKLDSAFDSDKELLDFDKFLPWGDVVLNDFSEVDLYDVDASQIFKNVRDYHSISANYLTDEQKEVVERYFGYRPTEEGVRGFWMHMNEGEKTTLKERYLQLWELMPELYRELRDRLEHHSSGVSMSMSGSVYRLALDRVRDMGAAALPWKHIVVVGLDWLATTEAEIFRELQKFTDEEGNPVIEFFWDKTGPILDERDNAAGRYIRRNSSRTHFPEPEWARRYLEANKRQQLPAMEEVAVPSNSVQTKVAGEWIRELLKHDRLAEIEDARVAVVLPDENLLMPLLYSLPMGKDDDRPAEGEKGETGALRNSEMKNSEVTDSEEPHLKDVNITMGWSMRYTSTAAFIYHLQKLHSRRQKTRGQLSYLSADLRLFLGQPLVQLVVGPDVTQTINGDLGRSKRRTLTLEEIRAYSPILGKMLDAKGQDTPFMESVSWLEEILCSVDQALSGNPEGFNIKTRIERQQLQHYLVSLGQIASAATSAGVGMRPGTLFHLLGRMVSGDKLQFEGEPLKGLQVMGVMETRALDFDRVMVLSMNDKVMPRRVRKRSFIPDSLRYGYGMPLSSHDEARHAYWFYRLLSRSREAVLVYDSRAGEGMRSGGKSRFLMQLEKIYARRKMASSQRVFKLSATESVIQPVPKSPSIMQRLESFKTEGGLTLSATSLQAYIKCPLLFFYRFVLRYGDDPEPTGFIDAITQGNIFHETMLRIYFEPSERRQYLKNGKVMSAARLQALLDDEAHLRRTIVRCVNMKFRNYRENGDDNLDEPLSPAAEMVAERLLKQVKAVLRYDLMRAPVTLVGGEIKDNVRWRVNNDLEVNMTASFDRVDRQSDGHLRVVDFKTGSVKDGMEKGLDSVFDGEFRAGNVLQLLLYAHMLQDMSRRHGQSAGPVEMTIFDTNGMEQGEGECHPFIGKKREKGKPVIYNDHPEVQDFIPRLNTVIEEIFSERPFEPTENPDNCRHCIMSVICGQ